MNSSWTWLLVPDIFLLIAIRDQGAHTQCRRLWRWRVWRKISRKPMDMVSSAFWGLRPEPRNSLVPSVTVWALSWEACTAKFRSWNLQRRKRIKSWTTTLGRLPTQLSRLERAQRAQRASEWALQVGHPETTTMIRWCRHAAWMSRPCIWFESPRGYAPWRSHPGPFVRIGLDGSAVQPNKFQYGQQHIR